MTDTPRDQLRIRIAQHLRSIEWMERHFGICAHAEDVAEAVVDLFVDVRESEWLKPGYVIADIRERGTDPPKEV